VFLGEYWRHAAPSPDGVFPPPSCPVMPLRSSTARRGTVRASVALATLAALTACADGVTAPTSSVTAAGTSFSKASSEFNNPRHEFHTREYFAREDAATGAVRYARPSSGTGISFHGGTVLQSGTKVVAIYWNLPAGATVDTNGYAKLPSGTGAGTGDGSLIGTFLSSLGSITDVGANKSYFNINHSYYGQTSSTTTAPITPTVAYTGYWNTTGSTNASGPAPLPTTSPTDAEMIALINWGISNGKLTYDGSTVYAIFTGRGVNLGGGFGSQYCAYHTHGTVSGTSDTFFYAAMPYNQQYPSGCTSQFASPNADKAANSELNTLAHEIEETTTDDMGNAWYDSRGNENADKCAWTWGTTATGASTGSSSSGTYNQSYNGYHFLVQQNWVNANSGGCATSYAF